MDKINRYRQAQTISFEDFFNLVTDTGICKYCNSYEECAEAMGMENIEAISGNGCSAFDCSIESLRQYYLLDKCVTNAQ